MLTRSRTPLRYAPLIATSVVIVALSVAAGCAERTRIVADTDWPPTGLAPTWEDHIERADGAIAVGERRRALTHLEGSLALQPESPDLLFRIAQLEMDLGHADRARSHLERGLRIKEDVAARRVLGFLLLQDAQFELARAAFEHVLSTAPNDVYALTHLGIADQALGRPLEAIEALESARAHCERTGTDSVAYLGRYLGLAYADAKQYDKALAVLASAEALTPVDATIPAQMGRVHDLSGDVDAALEAYRRARALDPQNAEVRDRIAALQRATYRGATSPPTPLDAWDGRPVRILPDAADPRRLKAPPAWRHTDAGIIVLLNRVEQECLPHGRSLVTTHRFLRLMTDYAVWRAEDVAVPYEGATEQVTAHVACAILPDGRRVDMLARSVREPLPTNATARVSGADTRWRLPLVLGLPAGTVLEYQVTKDQAAVNGGPQSVVGGITLGSRLPTVATQYALRAPATVAGSVRWQAVATNSDALAHRVDTSADGGIVTHIWEMGPVDAVREHEPAPRLIVSNAAE